MEERIITDQDIERYGMWMYQNEKNSRTIQKYCGCLKEFQKFMEGKNVEKQDVIAWKENRKAKLAPTTVNGILAALNGFFKYRGWHDCTVKFYRVRRQIFSQEQKELHKPEYERLVVAAKAQGNERLSLLLQTIASTGIRVSEVPYITVEAAQKGVAEVDCKGKIRIVFLTRALCRMLKHYAQKRGIRTGMIFVTRSGRAMDQSNIWREMKRLGAQAGVSGQKIFPHNLRHLFARTYYNQEKDLSRLADILGHSSVNTTRIYTMESGRNHARQLEKLNLLVRNGAYNRIPLLLYSRS